MAYVEVPKDLGKVKSKAIGSLTLRQAVGFGIGLGLGLPAYFFLQNIDTNIAMLALMILAFPSIFIALYEKDGIPADELLKSYIKYKFVNPPVRKYKITAKNKFLERGVRGNVYNKQKNKKKF